jgi:hypothetical protein
VRNGVWKGVAPDGQRLALLSGRGGIQSKCGVCAVRCTAKARGRESLRERENVTNHFSSAETPVSISPGNEQKKGEERTPHPQTLEASSQVLQYAPIRSMTDNDMVEKLDIQ